jgi:hypothetical protein
VIWIKNNPWGGVLMKAKTVLVSGLLLAAVVLAVLSAGPVEAQSRPVSGREVPYSTRIDINFQNGTGAGGYSTDVIPSNKRLVMEFVSVVVSVPPGDKPLLHVSDVVNGYGRPYWIPLTLTDPASAGGGAFDVYRATQLVKLYHEGNGVGGPGAQCIRNHNGFGPISCHVTVSGYLVDR